MSRGSQGALAKQEGEESKSHLLNPQDFLGLPVDELLARLQTSKAGLSEDEVERRQREYGRNEVVKKKKVNVVVRFLSYFKSPLILILLAAGFITAITSDPTDAFIIYSIILISVVLTYIQEHRAEQASQSLIKRVAITTTVVRNGEEREIGLPDLVPGDIITLSAGNLVPAESRVIKADNLFLDQSALTGESMAVEKTEKPMEKIDPEDTSTWENYLFMGTSVVTGSATAAVVRTGRNTFYSKIVEKLVERRPETEFERGARDFGLLIMRVTVILVTVVFLINALNHRSLLQSLLFSVALAVGLTPELLPMIITINLSKGAMSMSKKGVIVKRLESIQNYGSMDIICSDKTGTLTENKVSVVSSININGKEDEKVFKFAYLNAKFESGLKNPLDSAITSHKGVNPSGYEKLEEVPFDFERKRLSVILKSGDGIIMVTKGAPEEILNISKEYEMGDKQNPLDENSRKKIIELYHEQSAEGLRLLGVAYKRTEEKEHYSGNDESDMIFVGFVTFLDPPKQSARESINLLKQSGIEFKIITGDSELVTKKVAEELGFEITGLVQGKEITRMSHEELLNAVEGSNVFARVDPIQKNQIIEALRENGHVVGFLGDGVNDSPSIRTADVGISVDNATDIAKESADIILMKTDLHVLNDGVLEGRKTFGNTMKYIQMAISSNFGNMFSAAGASLFLSFLPLLPIQILLNNLLYDLSETTIPTDRVDRAYLMNPKRMNMKFIRDFMLYFGPLSSIFDFLTFGVLIFGLAAYGSLFQTAWFVESLVTQTLVVFAIRTRETPFFKSRPSLPLTLSTIAIVIVALLLPYSPIAPYFGFVPLPPIFYAILSVFVVAYIVLVEIVKIVFYKRHPLSEQSTGAQLDKAKKERRNGKKEATAGNSGGRGR